MKRFNYAQRKTLSKPNVKESEMWSKIRKLN